MINPNDLLDASIDGHDWSTAALCLLADKQSQQWPRDTIKALFKIATSTAADRPKESAEFVIRLAGMRGAA